MANPRNTVDFKGVGYRGFTYYVDGSTITFDETAVGGSDQAGRLVELVDGATSTVALLSGAGKILGKLIDVKADGACTVQTEGGAEITLAAAQSPAVGDVITGGATAGLGYVLADATTAVPGNPTVMKVVNATTVQVVFGH